MNDKTPLKEKKSLPCGCLRNGLRPNWVYDHEHSETVKKEQKRLKQQKGRCHVSASN